MKTLHTTAFLAMTAGVLAAQNRLELDGKDQVDRSIFGLAGASVGDIDGDGDLDVLAPRRLIENFLGRFSDQQGFEGVGQIFALEDFDRDGRLDVLHASSRPTVALNRLPFGMLDVGLPRAVSTRTPGVAVADFDGDGDADIVLTPRTSLENLALLLNDGLGNFTTASAAQFPNTVGVVRAQDAWPLDVDGDGDIDLMVEDDRSAQGMTVFDNLGNGTFGAPNSSMFSTPFDSILGWQDFDGDGVDDIVISRGRVLLRRGPDFVPSPVAYLPTLQFMSSVTSADIDLDGDRDVWVEVDGGRARWFENVGSTAPYVDQVARSPGTRRDVDVAAVTDFDGDGILDVLGVGARISLFRGQPGGRFHDLTPSRPSTGEFGDFNGDGLVDRLFIRGAFVWRLQAADGVGGFVESTPITSPVSRLVATFDIDGDGDLDAWASDWPLSNSRILRNDGAGVMQQQAGVLPPGLNTPVEIRHGDLDGDGDEDVVLYTAPSGSRSVHVLINDGTGTFSRPPAQQVQGLASVDMKIELGDVDGDGDLDLLVADTDLHLYVNDGAGAWTLAANAIPPRAPGNFWAPQSVRAGDLDLDGDVDILVVWRIGVSDPVVRLTNDGTGSFTATVVDTAGDSWGPAELVDVDLDGALDIAVVARSGSVSSFSVFYNDGAGIHALRNDPFDAPVPFGNGRFADVDGDGDADLLTSLGTVINHTRQLRSRFTPQLGASMELEISRLTRAFVHLSPTLTAPMPVPGLGTAVVGAGGATELFSSFRGPQTFVWRIPVPLVPSLVGVDVFVQAFDATPGREGLTNAIRETVLF